MTLPNHTNIQLVEIKETFGVSNAITPRPFVEGLSALNC